MTDNINKLRQGIENLFHEKFTENLFDINAFSNEHGYHMEYLGVRYNMNFFQPEKRSNANENIHFSLTVELEEEDRNLIDEIENIRISNRSLDKSRYLKKQEVKYNDKIIESVCVLKKTPKTNREVSAICKNLWGYIIQPIMKNVHYKKSDSK